MLDTLELRCLGCRRPARTLYFHEVERQWRIQGTVSYAAPTVERGPTIRSRDMDGFEWSKQRTIFDITPDRSGQVYAMVCRGHAEPRTALTTAVQINELCWPALYDGNDSIYI